MTSAKTTKKKHKKGKASIPGGFSTSAATTKISQVMMSMKH